jgi:EpsI family protein
MSGMRLSIATLLVVATAVVGRPAESSSARWRGDASLPLAIGDWRGADSAALDSETRRLLAADGIVNRVYTRSGDLPVELYVAYYERQRPGVSIHSPLHCLPGTGWEIASMDNVALGQPGATGRVRRLIVQKDRTRALVLYWYAIHGRMVTSEIASRMHLLGDRARFGRNDAALVRVVVPLGAGEDHATSQGVTFIRDLLPVLPRLWS